MRNEALLAITKECERHLQRLWDDYNASGAECRCKRGRLALSAVEGPTHRARGSYLFACMGCGHHSSMFVVIKGAVAVV